MLFRVRKQVNWGGVMYEEGELIDIEEGHPRLRAMIEQSHTFAYANVDPPKDPQGTPVTPVINP